MNSWQRVVSASFFQECSHFLQLSFIEASPLHCTVQQLSQKISSHSQKLRHGPAPMQWDSNNLDTFGSAVLRGKYNSGKTAGRR